MHSEELSDGEEIYDEIGGQNLTDGARTKGDGGEDRTRKIAKITGGSLHGTSSANTPKKISLFLVKLK